MALDPLIFIILLIVVYWVLDDVIGLFLYASAMIGVFMRLTTFVNVPDGLTDMMYFIISIIALATMGKFYHIINKKQGGT